MIIEPKDLPTEVMDEMIKTFPHISWEIYDKPRDSLSEQDQKALRSFKVDDYTIRGVAAGECFRPWQILLNRVAPVLESPRRDE